MIKFHFQSSFLTDYEIYRMKPLWWKLYKYFSWSLEEWNNLVIVWFAFVWVLPFLICFLFVEFIRIGWCCFLPLFFSNRENQSSSWKTIPNWFLWFDWILLERWITYSWIRAFNIPKVGSCLGWVIMIV